MDTREAEQQKTVTAPTHKNGHTEPVVTEDERRGPSRRIIFGIIGAIVAIPLNGSSIEAGLLAVLCALAGAFLGFHIRKEIVERMDCADWQAAGVEDVIAVTCAVVAMGIITA